MSIRKDQDLENAIVGLIALAVIGLIAVGGIAAGLCVLYLVAWLAQAVFAGFGLALPFWPLYGAALLIALAGWWFAGRR